MDITARVNELIQKGVTFCLATVIASKSAGIAAGRKMIVLDKENLEGELGDGQLELTVRELALEAINGKKRDLVEIKPGLHIFFDHIY